MRRVFLTACVGACLGRAPPLAAQARMDVDLDLGTVKYEGFLGSAAAAVTPSIRYDSRAFAAALQGGYLLYESGRSLVQAAGAAAWLTPAIGAVRGELSGFGGVAAYADAPGVTYGMARARLHLVGRGRGAWAGIGLGGLTASSLETRTSEAALGAWMVRRPGVLTGMIAWSTAADSSYLDLSLSGRASTSSIEVDAVIGVRPWTQIGDAGPFADLALRLPLTRAVAVQLKAGSYPADPLRAGVAGTYVSAGVRVTPWRGSVSVPPPEQRLREALRVPVSDADAGTPALTVRAADGDVYEFLVAAPSGSTVELAADFTDWQPRALEPLGGDRWRLRVTLEPGIYRLNVRVDGGPWLVPRGATPLEDEFGGVVGLTVVRR